MVSPDSGATESFFSDRSGPSHKTHLIFVSSGSSVESSSEGTESKPSSRTRVVEENEATKPSSKKTKAKTAVTELEKSAKKTGRIWNRKDEAAFLNELVACCRKGKGLPPNMLPVYDQIRSKLDGDYTTNQLYDKQRGLRTKLGKFRDKVMDKGFRFKNAHEEAVYKLSMQLWGKEEEDGSGDQKIGKKTHEKVGQKGKQHVKECEGEEREEVKRKQVKEDEVKEGVKRKLVKNFEVEEIETAKRKHVKDSEGKAGEGLKDDEGEVREEAKGKLVKNDERKESSRFMDIFASEVDLCINELKNDIMKMVSTALQGLSNTSINANLKFPINERVSSAREFPALSNSDVEMLDRKWKTQQLVELEANSKHLALLLEENELCMAKLSS